MKKKMTLSGQQQSLPYLRGTQGLETMTSEFGIQERTRDSALMDSSERKDRKLGRFVMRRGITVFSGSFFFFQVEVEPGRGSKTLLQTWNSQEEGWKAASDNLLLGFQKRSRLTVIGASISEQR